jgi:hypothetical protein
MIFSSPEKRFDVQSSSLMGRVAGRVAKHALGLDPGVESVRVRKRVKSRI